MCVKRDRERERERGSDRDKFSARKRKKPMTISYFHGRDNFLRVDVFYGDLKYQFISQHKSYEALNFFST